MNSSLKPTTGSRGAFRLAATEHEMVKHGSGERMGRGFAHLLRPGLIQLRLKRLFARPPLKYAGLPAILCIDLIIWL